MTIIFIITVSIAKFAEFVHVKCILILCFWILVGGCREFSMWILCRLAHEITFMYRRCREHAVVMLILSTELHDIRDQFRPSLSGLIVLHANLIRQASVVEDSHVSVHGQPRPPVIGTRISDVCVCAYFDTRASSR